MDVDAAVLNVQQLTDLELAMLLCLMSNNHGVIQVDDARRLDGLEQELKWSASHTFGLTCTGLRCDPSTTLEEFISGLLVKREQVSSSSTRDRSDYYNMSSDDGLCIPNVAVVRDLQRAERQVQIQALELMRSGRVFTRTSVQTAPKHFLLLAVSATGSSERLVDHVRDHMFLSHVHEADDEFQRLEEEVERDRVRRAHGVDGEDAQDKGDFRLMPTAFVDALSRSSEEVTSTVEMTRYLNDVVVFLRMHRGVAGGTTPIATKQLATMSKCLAVLHDLPYVTPPFVGLATRKVFPHRLTLVEPENERSLQYGSDLQAVTAILRGMTPESIIEEVLDTVECPV